MTVIPQAGTKHGDYQKNSSRRPILHMVIN
jgi:hypothetical protein